MYTAILLILLGIPLIVRSLWGAATGIVLICPGLWARIRQEEAMLLEAFGAEYRAYQARTQARTQARYQTRATNKKAPQF